MKITRASWDALTLGEKLSILDYAAYVTRKYWERRMRHG